MKTPFYKTAVLGCAAFLAACTGPLIIDEEQQGGPDSEVHQRDSVPIVHEGTYECPYTVGEALTLARGRSLWVEGYIVGCVKGSMRSGCNFTDGAETQSNVLLSDTFPTGAWYDYLYCLPVELPNGSDEREALNLYDTPANYHRKLRIQGDLTLYYSVVGMKKVADYSFVDSDNDDEEENLDTPNHPDNPTNPDNPSTPSDPDATTTDTLTIAEGIALQNQGEQYYIRGYIVGFFNGSSFRFHPSEEEITSRANNNVVLADSIGFADPQQVIIVELPSATALRRDVNLHDHPHNLHRRLTVKGTLMNYNKTDYYGCMGTLSALRDDEDYYFWLE